MAGMTKPNGNTGSIYTCNRVRNYANIVFAVSLLTAFASQFLPLPGGIAGGLIALIILLVIFVSAVTLVAAFVIREIIARKQRH
jgi:NADH:ubiquinone oxidoreductase subunit 4 (subunit M)